jgi:hypothetical protein
MKYAIGEHASREHLSMKYGIGEYARREHATWELEDRS